MISQNNSRFLVDSHRTEYRAVIPKLRQGSRVGIIKIPLSPRFSLRWAIRVAACVLIVMNFHGAVIMEFLRRSIVETNRPNSLFLMGIMEIVLKVKKKSFPLFASDYFYFLWTRTCSPSFFVRIYFVILLNGRYTMFINFICKMIDLFVKQKIAILFCQQRHPSLKRRKILHIRCMLYTDYTIC